MRNSKYKMTIYQDILQCKKDNKKLLAILIDPEKVSVEKSIALANKIIQSPATHVFVGGSSYNGNHINELIATIKNKTHYIIYYFKYHTKL